MVASCKAIATKLTPATSISGAQMSSLISLCTLAPDETNDVDPGESRLQFVCSPSRDRGDITGVVHNMPDVSMTIGVVYMKLFIHILMNIFYGAVDGRLEVSSMAYRKIDCKYTNQTTIFSFGN